MPTPHETGGFLRRWWRRVVPPIRRDKGFGFRMPVVDNPIGQWGGVLDRSGDVSSHLGALRARLDSRTPHERDFGFFSSLEGNDGLFVDVGANAGQSAVSLRCVNRSLRILSFEPNPLLEPILRGLRDGILDDFDYRMTGLSDRRRSRILHIPVIDGLVVTPLATLDAGVFERDHFDEQLRALSRRGAYEVEQVEVDLVPLDDLDLQPAAIKIDTEEHEVHCLRGMTATIRRCTPVLMIERNPQAAEIEAALGELGYRPFAYDPRDRVLRPAGDSTETVNVFYLHSAHRTAGLGLTPRGAVWGDR